MDDNNNSIYNKNCDFTEKSKDALQYLKSLIDEIEEQLNDDTFQKKHVCLLQKEKEQELFERERKKVHNLDLFSPIHSKTYDTSDINSEIDNFIHQVEELDKEQALLLDKKNNLMNVYKCMEYYTNLSFNNEKTIVLDKKFNDKGLNILEAQERERQRIARDLHDSTVQNLTSLVHKTELCSKLIGVDSIRAKLELTTMSNTIKTTINDMRDTIYNLKPMSLDDLGLVVTVERYAKQLMITQDIQIFIHNNYEKEDVLPVIKLTLFRIIQEACRNVIKHANAKIIKIDISYDDQRIIVAVMDNGIGFDVVKQQAKGSEESSNFGLSIMRERISLLSGTLEIISEKEKGTIVTISVPLTIREGEKNEQTN